MNSSFLHQTQAAYCWFFCLLKVLFRGTVWLLDLIFFWESQVTGPIFLLHRSVSTESYSRVMISLAENTVMGKLNSNCSVNSQQLTNLNTSYIIQCKCKLWAHRKGNNNQHCSQIQQYSPQWPQAFARSDWILSRKLDCHTSKSHHFLSFRLV